MGKDLGTGCIMFNFILNKNSYGYFPLEIMCMYIID